MLLLEVSIPFRGFRCLQRIKDYNIIAILLLFQSLSGVLGVCNDDGYNESNATYYEFQSLSGVLGVCNEAMGIWS